MPIESQITWLRIGKNNWAYANRTGPIEIDRARLPLNP
jgi:hypothetical protein